MKKQLLLSCALLGMLDVASGQGQLKKEHKARFERVKTEMLSRQARHSAAKGAATDPVRLTSFATYEDGALRDSCRYVYGGDRATEIQPADPYATSIFYTPLGQKRPMEIGDNSHDYMPYDTAFMYVSGSGGLELRYWCYKAYDENDRLIELRSKDYYFPTSISHNKTEVTYDGSSNRMKTVLNWQDTTPDASGAFEPFMLLSIGYDSELRRVYDSSYSFSATSLSHTHYVYNSAGRVLSLTTLAAPDGTVGVDDVRFLFTYDDENRLTQATWQYYSDEWTTSWEDVYGYTGSSSLPTYHLAKQIFEPGGALQPYAQEDAILIPGQDRYDTLYMKEDMSGTGLLQNVSFYKYHYNEDGLIATQEMYLWTGTSGISAGKALGYSTTPHTVTAWKYSPVNPTSVPAANMAQESSSVLLYPNPATSHIFVEAAGKVNVSVYNLSGQLLLQQSSAAQNGGVQLNVASLPAGTYVADVQTEKGSSKVKFVKQ